MCVKRFEIVVGLALLCAVSGISWAEPQRSVPEYSNDVSELLGTWGTGKNWLNPYVRLLDAVIPPSHTVGSASAGGQRERHAVRPGLRLNPRSLGNGQQYQAYQPFQITQLSQYPVQTLRPSPTRAPLQRPFQAPVQPGPPPPPQQNYHPLQPNRQAPASPPPPYHTSQPAASFLPLTPAKCSGLTNKHEGTFTPLVRPTTANIYKKKSEGDREAMSALAAARAAVAARTMATREPWPERGPAPVSSYPGASSHLLSVSNPKTRSRPNSVDGVPRMLDVCARVWSQETSQQRTDTDHIDLFAFFSTLEVPETVPATSPMPPLPTEASVADTCDLPPPYMDDRYDWLEIVAAHGGLPGCVNATQLPEQQKRPRKAYDPCVRPLNETFPGEELYTYMLSDLRSFYRNERAYLRFPGESHQFVDVRGLLVWTSPPDDGNVYVVEYIVDDTGLWIHIPENTCSFVDTMTLTCTGRLKCWCQDGKSTCLAQQGLSGNLYASLVGGG